MTEYSITILCKPVRGFVSQTIGHFSGEYQSYSVAYDDVVAKLNLIGVNYDNVYFVIEPLF